MQERAKREGSLVQERAKIAPSKRVTSSNSSEQSEKQFKNNENSCLTVGRRRGLLAVRNVAEATKGNVRSFDAKLKA